MSLNDNISVENDTKEEKMCFFDFGKSKKLLEWQNKLLAEPLPRLKFNEKQLLKMTLPRIENDLRIINDCKRILMETTKPDVFFPRLKLMEEKTMDLVLFEPYVPFKGAKPSAALEEFYQDKKICIYDFVLRYYNAVDTKAKGLKTQKAQIRQYQNFYESLQEYYGIMSEECINYIEKQGNVYSYIQKIK